jgi:hypothetical protein
MGDGTLQSGLEEGEHGHGQLTMITMFALFEAGNQVMRLNPTPRFGYASRG